ncbi:MAG TPA: hypothetical protein PLS69_07790, partial [Terricaulis sp.]|nr:hypothetical protein [Terricaulis sp.]
RWRRGVCVGATGLGVEQAQFLVDRVSQRAREVGLTPGSPGCDANVVVVFTADPNGVATAITRSRDFGVGGRARTNSREALAGFTRSSAPVRWWYVWQSVAETGEVANQDQRGGQGPQVAVQDRRIGAGRTRDDLTHVFIVVDGPQIANVNMNALGDYIAYAALAQVDPAAPPAGAGSSILGLFTDSQPADGLTSADRAVLQALYN